MNLREQLGPVGEMLGGLHRSGTALIRKGTAMDPLIPMVILVPILGGLAWLCREVAVLWGVPSFSALCFVGIVVIIGVYVWHYSRFATRDPDRLQSERYRVRMEQLELQRIWAKDGPWPVEELESPTPNPEAQGDSGGVEPTREERNE